MRNSRGSSTLLDTYAEERLAIRDLLCTCPSALGYTTSEECETGLGEIDGAGKQCIDAFGGQESLGEDYFECVLPLQDQYRDCIYAGLTCGDGWFLPCEARHVTDAVERRGLGLRRVPARLEHRTV